MLSKGVAPLCNEPGPLKFHAGSAIHVINAQQRAQDELLSVKSIQPVQLSSFGIKIRLISLASSI